MPAQVFKSIFTADVSQYKGEIQVLKQTTQDVVGQIRGSWATLAGLGVAGFGVKELVGDIIRLGAEMQQTRTAFEVMLGSAEAAGKVIAELNYFADVTPFDNDEVIKSGRLLMNAGVATEDLSAKLTTLGDISAGAQVPLLDMVAIYAKAANKGKVQAEELNQLSERGVPVMQALAATLGRTTQEILDMGAKGQLSFALLDEALASLSAEGGRYFGLMDKQSQNLAGRWSVVTAEIRNTGIAIGEEAIPALSAALEDFAAALDEMSRSGELDTIVRDTAAALGEIANNLKEITVWMVKHQKAVKAIAGGAFWIGVAVKTRGIVMSLAKGLQGLAAAQAAQAGAAAASAAATAGASGATAGMAAATAAAGAAAEATAVKVGFLATALKGVGTAAAVAGSVLSTMFIGWQIGKALAEMLELEKVFTRMLARGRGLSDAEIDAGGVDQVTASIEAADLAAAEREKAELQARLAKLAEMGLPTETEAELSVDSSALEADLERINGRIAQAQEAGDQGLEQLAATDEQIKRLLDEREGLERRLAGRATAAERERITLQIGEIDAKAGEYRQKAEAEIAAIEDTEKRLKEAQAELVQAIRGKQEADERFKSKRSLANSREFKARQEANSAVNDAQKKVNELRQLELAQRKTAEEYQAAQKAMEEYKASGRVQRAEELSAVDKFRAEEQKRLQEEVSAHLDRLTRGETELKRAEWAKQVASYREAFRKAGLDGPEKSARLDELEAAGYAAIDEERRKKQQGLHDHLAKLTLSETDQKKRELARQLEEYRKAGATQQQLARLQAAGLAQIEKDKNQKILTAQRQLETARRNLAESRADRRLEAMMRQLDAAGARLQKELGKFGFRQDEDWRQLAKNPRERRARRRQVQLDEQIEGKMAAAVRGERVRFTKAEQERIRERERIERRLAENERKRRREQRDADGRRQAGREKELARAAREAQQKLAEAQGRPAGAPRRQAAPLQQRQPQRPQPEKPVEVPEKRPWLSELRSERPELRPGARPPDAIGALAGVKDYSGHLEQILRQMEVLNQRIFVVKGA